MLLPLFIVTGINQAAIKMGKLADFSMEDISIINATLVHLWKEIKSTLFPTEKEVSVEMSPYISSWSNTRCLVRQMLPTVIYHTRKLPSFPGSCVIFLLFVVLSIMDMLGSMFWSLEKFLLEERVYFHQIFSISLSVSNFTENSVGIFIIVSVWEWFLSYLQVNSGHAGIYMYW